MDDKKANTDQEPSLTYGDGGMVTNFSDLDLNKVYTYAQYLTWRFAERVELIKGRIFKMSPGPNRLHQRLSGDIFIAFGNYLKGKPCEVYSAPFDVRFPNGPEDNNPYTVVQPDICIVCDTEKLDDKGCNGAPDLIVEILSPSTSARDIHDKYHLYEEHGVKEYWIVDPINNIIDIFVLGDKEKYQLLGKFNAYQTISSTLFPDLKIDLTEVFEIE